MLGAAAVAGIVAWAVAVRDDGAASPRPPGRVASAGVAEVGDPAPDFTLSTLDGASVTLAELKGRPVVVNFWASWCNPCREEFPLLAEALDSHENADLAIVGITYRDIESDSRDFVEDMGVTWPQGVDEDNEVARAFGVRAIPQTFFIDRDGNIAARVFGFSSERALEEPLAKILEG